MTATTCTHLQPPCTHLALTPATCTHHHPLMGCGVVVVASDRQPPCTHLDVFMASNIRAQIGGPAMLITIRPGPVLHVWHCGKEAAAVPLTPSATLTLCRDLLAALAGDMQP